MNLMALPDRKVLPRWFTASHEGGFEVAGLARGIRTAQDFSVLLEKTKGAWLYKSDEPRCSEFLAAALFAGEIKAAEEAARFALKQSSSVALKKLANRVLGDQLEGDKPRRTIANLKARLRVYPRDALTCADMAYFYALEGQREKAFTAMVRAHNLAPDNPFLLRIASRCFLHLGHKERSLWVIRNLGLWRNNPWLAASEIALSQLLGEPSRAAMVGSRLLENRDFSKFANSELAVALASLEAANGRAQRARKLIKFSLEDPNENALSQAISLAPRVNYDMPIIPQVACSFEAHSQDAHDHGSYDVSYSYACEWQRLQPFSARPAIWGSYLASLFLFDYEKALKVLEPALMPCSDNPTVLNNYAYALIQCARLDEADAVIQQAKRNKCSVEASTALLATEGLLAIRRGNVELGFQHYKEAINSFMKQKDSLRAIVAAMCMLLEASQLDPKLVETTSPVWTEWEKRFADSAICTMGNRLRQAGSQPTLNSSLPRPVASSVHELIVLLETQQRT